MASSSSLVAEQVHRLPSSPLLPCAGTSSVSVSCAPSALYVLAHHYQDVVDDQHVKDAASGGSDPVPATGDPVAVSDPPVAATDPVTVSDPPVAATDPVTVSDPVAATDPVAVSDPVVAEGPHRIRILRPRRIHEKLTAIENFVDADEIAELLQLAEGRWRRSTTAKAKQSHIINQHGGEGETNYSTRDFRDNTPSNTRTSSSCVLDSPDDRSRLVIRRLQKRVAALCEVEDDENRIEPPNLVRYREGEFFEVHHDGVFRSHTVFVYLNHVENGGRTIFPALNLGIRPRAGLAVMWKNVKEGSRADLDLLHRGEAVGPGEVKYGVNCFVGAAGGALLAGGTSGV